MPQKIRVGVLTAPKIEATFIGNFSDEIGNFHTGSHTFHPSNIPPRGLLLKADSNASFILSDVAIGIDFHWERREQQQFAGDLLIKHSADKITAINIIDIESYLESVVSSEMRPDAHPEFIKAHAVISRSWLMAQILAKKSPISSESFIQNDDEIIRWYDHETHADFDVCADDHCQRYQGIGRIHNPKAVEAVRATAGLVLTHDGEICDARFSKCCGGAFETFENCWQPTPKPYLLPGRDAINHPLPDLSIEENARQWILSSPEAFCNTADINLLDSILNDYDLETPDFYRWKITINREELSELIAEKSGFDFGEIGDLVALERGVSGRITRLKIIGTKRSMTVGKELEIRRLLSPTHLKSAAFIVEKGRPDKSGLPKSFTLYGAGWGHGVGLCQIGAAAMAAAGHNFRQILQHYFPNTILDVTLASK